MMQSLAEAILGDTQNNNSSPGLYAQLQEALREIETLRELILAHEAEIARLKKRRAKTAREQRPAPQPQSWVEDELRRIIGLVHPDRHPKGVPHDLVCKELNALRTLLKESR